MVSPWSITPHFAIFWFPVYFGSTRRPSERERSRDLATIVVIPKTNPPSLDRGSYSPISLINAGIKVYAKILATRLHPILTSLIHPGQCGFMPNCSTPHCIRLLQCALADAEKLTCDLVLFLVDCEKAYETLDCDYLVEGLHGMGHISAQWCHFFSHA